MATGTVKSGWKSVQSVSLPFTPTSDGFLLVNVNPSSSATALYYITEDGNTFLNVVSSSGVRAAESAPVQRGKAYANSYSSNISSVSIKFYQL